MTADRNIARRLAAALALTLVFTGAVAAVGFRGLSRIVSIAAALLLRSFVARGVARTHGGNLVVPEAGGVVPNADECLEDEPMEEIVRI